eukprot:14187356-Heterocapsa_arctica.AAC.1
MNITESGNDADQLRDVKVRGHVNNDECTEGVLLQVRDHDDVDADALVAPSRDSSDRSVFLTKTLQSTLEDVGHVHPEGDVVS